MGRTLKIALIFIGIPAIILAAIFFPNVPWSDIALATVPPKFKAVILPTELQDALLTSQDGTEIHPAGPMVLLPKDTSVIHGEKVEPDGICIYTADVHRNLAHISQKFCLSLKDLTAPAGYHIRVVATYRETITLPYTFINSDTGLASWLTIPDNLMVNFYVAKLASAPWTAPADKTWEETIPKYLRLYPAGYNVISPYSGISAGISTLPYPYAQDLETLAVAKDGQQKMVKIVANCRVDVIEVSSDWGTYKTYHLLITPLYPVNTGSVVVHTNPPLRFLTSVHSRKYGHALNGTAQTTKLITGADVSFGLNLGTLSVSLSGFAGIYAPPIWAHNVPVVWITGSTSAVPAGDYKVYTSSPDGAYLFVKR